MLSSQFKLKVLVSMESAVICLARAYFSRIGVTIEETREFAQLLRCIDEADAVVDEGWKFSEDELRQLSKRARKKPMFKIGGGYKISASGAKGGQEIWRADHWR